MFSHGLLPLLLWRRGLGRGGRFLAIVLIQQQWSSPLSQPQSSAMQKEVEILLVEDDANDVELTLIALRKHNLANKIFVVRDGEEALDFLFCRGQYAQRTFDDAPKVVFLDLKLPKISGLE